MNYLYIFLFHLAMVVSYPTKALLHEIIIKAVATPNAYSGGEITKLIDTNPPQLIQHTQLSSKQYLLRFDRAIDISNVLVQLDSIIQPSSSYELIPPHSLKVIIHEGFTPNKIQALYINQLLDTAGNKHNYKIDILSNNRLPKSGEVVISEWMARPSTPLTEFIELTNSSLLDWNLKDWHIGDSKKFVKLPSILIASGKTVVLIKKGEPFMADESNTVPLESWAILNNDKDKIRLADPFKNNIDSTSYGYSFSPVKNIADGRSIERVDVRYLCNHSVNWEPHPHSHSAGYLNHSRQLLGGGISMVQQTVNHDILSIQFSSLSIEAPKRISINSQDIQYEIRAGGLIICKGLEIVYDKPYHIRIDSLRNCKNEVLQFNDRFYLYKPPETGDLLINEVMFESGSGYDDYIEIHNISSYHLQSDSLQLHFAGKKVDISSPRPLLPDEYRIVTGAGEDLKLHFPEYSISYVMEESLLLNNQEGIISLHHGGRLIDSIHYNSDWHYPFLADSKGVSLERMKETALATTDAHWSSSISKAGGTPGGINSKRIFERVQAEILQVYPDILDYHHPAQREVQIQWSLPPGDWTVRLTAAPMSFGSTQLLFTWMPVSCDSHLLWQGQNTQGEFLPSGMYVLNLEAFSLEGQKLHARKVMAVK